MKRYIKILLLLFLLSSCIYEPSEKLKLKLYFISGHSRVEEVLVYPNTKLEVLFVEGAYTLCQYNEHTSSFEKIKVGVVDFEIEK